MKTIAALISVMVLFTMTAQAEDTIYRLKPGEFCKMGYDESLPNGNPNDSWCVKSNDWMNRDPIVMMDFSGMVPNYDMYRPTEEEDSCRGGYIANYHGIKGILWCTEVNEYLERYRPLENEECLDGFEDKNRGSKHVRWCIR